VVFVFAGQKFLANRAAFNLRPIVILWNAILAVFSITGALTVVPSVYGLYFFLTYGSNGWLF
jgi:hypothetical protein